MLLVDRFPFVKAGEMLRPGVNEPKGLGNGIRMKSGVGVTIIRLRQKRASKVVVWVLSDTRITMSAEICIDMKRTQFGKSD